MSTERKIEYLKFAIEDAQEIIRFIDTKTAIAISIVGAYIVGIFAIIEKIVKYYDNYNYWFWIFLIIFIVYLILSTIVVTRIIKPVSNPIDHIELKGQNLPKVPFYLGKNSYSNSLYPFFHSKKNRLEIDYKKYLDSINAADEQAIIESLSFELLKVSFIRNIKNDRFNRLTKLLIFSSLLFVSFYILYTVETENAAQKKQGNEPSKIQILKIENNHTPPSMQVKKAKLKNPYNNLNTISD